MLTSCSFNESEELDSIKYDISDQKKQTTNQGVVIPYTHPPLNKAFLVDCKFYDTQMSMITRLYGHFCKPFKIDNKIYYISISNEGISLLNFNGDTIWNKAGYYNHDVDFNDQNKQFYALENYMVPIRGTDYSYFRITTINFDGTSVKQWNTHEHLERFQIISAWKKTLNNVSYPAMAKIHKRPMIFNANFLKVIDKEWNGLKKGTILVHVRYLNSLIAFDDNFNITWFYTFHKDITENLHDIHTPLLQNDNSILVFNNQIEMNDRLRSGISQYFLDKSDINHIFLTPIEFENQTNPQTFGSIQKFEDDSILMSTGGEYGGIIHLLKNNEILFKWLNPQKDPETNISMPFYRASLIPLDWVPRNTSDKSK